MITGGGTGIGREIACTFASNGAIIIICDINLKSLEKTKMLINKSGGKACAIESDISEEKQVSHLISNLIQQFGRLDILINNASIVGQVSSVENLNLLEWNKTLSVNLTGAMLCCRESIPYLRTSKGSIVNVSSNVGRRGFPNRSPYVCSKWALQGLTQTTALELAKFDIRVNAICPGPVLTDRLKHAAKLMAEKEGVTLETIMNNWALESPMGRFVTEKECAKAALFLASQDSSGITGQSLNITAGALMT